MTTMLLSKMTIFAISFFAFLVFAATVYRFVMYVKTLHLIEEIQDDILDSNFEAIQGIEVEPKAEYCPKCRRIHKPKIRKPNTDKPSNTPRKEL